MILFAGCSSVKEISVGPLQGEKWHAIHLIGYETDEVLAKLGSVIPALDSIGINVIILEVDYNFEFQTHPELRRGEHPITKKGARIFARICKKNNIKLITEFQCVGHQSWAEETFPLLTEYPQSYSRSVSRQQGYLLPRVGCYKFKNK